MKNNFYIKGISVLEILIVIAIIGIISAVVFPQFSNLKKTQVIKSATVDVLSVLEKARSQTLSSLNSSQYGVHLESDKVIIFKGTVFSVNGVENETINLISPAIISNINLSGGGSEIYFNRISGSPNKTGTITISNSDLQKIITISATGIASIN